MNETEVLNAVNLLIREGMLLNSGGVLVSTGKLRRFYQDVLNGSPLEQKPAETAVVFQKKLLSLKEFRDKAQIPFQIKSANFNYNVGQISVPGERAYNKAIVGVNMEKLIEATKQFYNNPKNARPTLTKYFVEGIWEQVYQNFIKEPEVAKPNFTGERSI